MGVGSAAEGGGASGGAAGAQSDSAAAAGGLDPEMHRLQGRCQWLTNKSSCMQAIQVGILTKPLFKAANCHSGP